MNDSCDGCNSSAAHRYIYQPFFSEVLTNNKWPLGVDPGGHNFAVMCVLNVSINNTPDFVS